ncbi:MAG: hypothetical protein ABIV47_24020 [Roseiflexaceae bacterium]
MSTHHAALAFVGAGALGQAFAGFLAASRSWRPRRARRSSTLIGMFDCMGVQELAIPIAVAPAPAGIIGITTDPAQLRLPMA